MRRQNQKGFTLIELLVVLALIAIISAIAFGAFKSVSEGNKRTSCQSNLSQIYKSVRLYAQDYDGNLPYLNEQGDPNMANYTDVSATPRGGIGLWSLYTFGKPGFQSPVPYPANGDTNCSPTSVDLPAQVEDSSQVAAGYVGLTGYVRSTKIFHCPADNFAHDVEYRDLTDKSTPTYECKTTSQPVNSPTLLVPVGNYNYLNPFYLSYQVTDDSPLRDAANTNTGQPTYSSFRKPENSNNNKIQYRQITPYKLDLTTGQPVTVDRSIKDMTVLTWCRFHRALTDTGATKSERRAFDNVLFSDGSVQSLPVKQDVTIKATGEPGACYGWQRVPREKADDMLFANSPSDDPSDSKSTNCVPLP